MAGAVESIRMLVAQAVIDAVGLIKTRSDDVHILGVAGIVAPENGVGDMVGELNQA